MATITAQLRRLIEQRAIGLISPREFNETREHILSRARATLLLRPGVPGESEVLFEGPMMSIGRGKHMDLRIEGDPRVARYHCRIIAGKSGYWIEDNTTPSGTRVDGELIQRTALIGGEKIVVGGTPMTFLLE